MERVRVFCLLLLVCSLSGAELQDNEITGQRIPSPVSLNVSEQPQSSLSDIHAALRDMSAALAEHRIRIEQLQTQNQELEAKLREQTTEVDTLKQKLQVGQVAFSASLWASGGGYTGPFNTDTTLVFRNVFSNIGNAYSPNTGFFIAPVTGAFHFEVHICSWSTKFHSTGVALVKNGQHIVRAHERGINGHSSAANGVTLLLQAGDAVFLRLWRSTTIYDDGNRYTTFSGHLLFPM